MQPVAKPDIWTRTRTKAGPTLFTAFDGKVIVSARTWPRPGFHRNGMSRGWTIEVGGTQVGPAHRTATAAMRHAELPGVAALIRELLDARE